jgi:hypothetical protein
VSLIIEPHAIVGTPGNLIRFDELNHGINSIVSESAGQLNVDGAVKLFATAEGGWIDIPPLPQLPALGVAIPTMTAWSAPHNALSSPRFSAGTDTVWFAYHIPHGVNVAEGIYMHAHFIVDSTSTTPVVVQWICSYADGSTPGRMRSPYSAPTTVTATLTPNGVPKTGYIAEIATPIFAGAYETDGIVKAQFKLISGPDILLEICDAHAKLLGPCSANRMYPFGAPT